MIVHRVHRPQTARQFRRGAPMRAIHRMTTWPWLCCIYRLGPAAAPQSVSTGYFEALAR